MLTIYFHKTDNLIGKAIRFQTQGVVNHVSFKIGKKVYDADIGQGVQAYDTKKHSVVKTYTFKGGDIKTAQEFADKQVGKDYDLLGVLSFIWGFIPERKGSWYCSEYAMVVLMKYLGVKSEAYNQKQSPQSLLELCNLLTHENIK